MDVLHRATTLRRTAAELLRVTDLGALLARLGQVHEVGSFRLDVMFRPDIDLIVTSATPSRDQAIARTQELLERGQFQTVGFADCFSFWKPGAPAGFYWELIAPYAGDWWKIDVWYLTPKDDISIRPAEQFEQRLQNNPGARETILRIKEHFFDGVKYRDGVTGFAIYDAVLNVGVDSLAGFIQARRSHAQ
jgi:hypothetical protein